MTGHPSTWGSRAEDRAQLEKDYAAYLEQYSYLESIGSHHTVDPLSFKNWCEAQPAAYRQRYGFDRRRQRS